MIAQEIDWTVYYIDIYIQSQKFVASAWFTIHPQNLELNKNTL